MRGQQATIGQGGRDQLFKFVFADLGGQGRQFGLQRGEGRHGRVLGRVRGLGGQGGQLGLGVGDLRLERGYGGQPNVTLDGQEVDGVRAPVCNQGEGLVACNGSGTTVGHLYTFDLGNKNGGWFEFSNSSLVPPHNRLSVKLYIR